MLLDGCHHGRGRAGYHLAWEVSDDGLEVDDLLGVGLIELVDLDEELLVGVVADTLEQPVDGRLEEGEVLVQTQLGVTILKGIVVMFVHEL
jgi:hypothetical protein